MRPVEYDNEAFIEYLAEYGYTDDGPDVVDG